MTCLQRDGERQHLEKLGSKHIAEWQTLPTAWQTLPQSREWHVYEVCKPETKRVCESKLETTAIT
jgi:hypothetical protein